MGTRIDDYSDNPEIAKMIHDTKFCLNCGRRLKRGHGLKVDRGYCSRDCYFAKPPKMAYLEMIHNKPAREVIAHYLTINDNIPLTAELVGVTKQTLYRWVDNLNIVRKVEWR